MYGQKHLDFASAGASRADRRNQLLLAVDRADGGKDLHLMVFVERVWECWERGEPLVASYAQLAGPRMLRCSESKARRTVVLARDAGLVRVEDRYDGTCRPNAYHLLAGAHPEQVPVHPEQVPVHPEQVPVHPEHAGYGEGKGEWSPRD